MRACVRARVWIDLFEIMNFFLVYFFFRDENLHNLCDLKKFDQLSTGFGLTGTLAHIYVHACVCAPILSFTLENKILCLFNANGFFFVEFFFSRISFSNQKKFIRTKLVIIEFHANVLCVIMKYSELWNLKVPFNT